MYGMLFKAKPIHGTAYALNIKLDSLSQLATLLRSSSFQLRGK